MKPNLIFFPSIFPSHYKKTACLLCWCCEFTEVGTGSPLVQKQVKRVYWDQFESGAAEEKLDLSVADLFSEFPGPDTMSSSEEISNSPPRNRRRSSIVPRKSIVCAAPLVLQDELELKQ